MYGDRENTKWFNQTLMTHKDKFYDTDGYLKVSIVTNTSDYSQFNQPSLSISIQNNYQKSYSLSYHNACDLLRTLRVVKTQTNGDKSEIQRKYQKNMILYIQFFVESNNNNSVVDIRLLSNETDFTKIIIPVEIFQTFGQCLKYYVENYFDICTKLLMKSIDNEATAIIHQLPQLIKGISSQIVPQEIMEIEEIPKEVEQKVAKTQATIEDLDKFLGGDDMSNIKVPELHEDEKEKPKPLVEVDSLLVKHVLKNDLTNLESMLNNHAMNRDPIRTLANELHTTLDPSIKGEFSLLSGIDDDNMKSLLYMSKLFCTTSHINHVMNNAPIPSSIPVFKYTNKNASVDNLNIAYDLFLFGLYIKIVRNRLEGKTTDSTRNKSLLHLQLRCFTDVFVFSCIGKDQTTNLESVISNRYKYFDSIGVFDKYKQLVEEIKCPEIKDYDISSAVNEAIEKVIGKSPDVNVLHTKANGSFRMPAKNSFSLEQIINEIIPLEIAEKTGKDIKSDSVMAELNKNTPISMEIHNFFTQGATKVKVKKEKKESIFSNNLHRVVNFYSDEVPEQYRTDFIDSLSKQGETDFDIVKCKFPLDEFGDNIVKALYLWNPSDNPKVTKSYKYFQVQIEKELMEKDLILAKIKTEITETTETDEWDFSLE